MAKSQFQSTEDMLIRFSPFINSTTGESIIGTDTATVTIKKPNNSTITPSMVWDTDVHIWTLSLAYGVYYAQGEWKFEAVSNDPDAFHQWKVLQWGDYVGDISTAASEATGANSQATGANTQATGAHTGVDTLATTVGSPSISIAADIAATKAAVLALPPVYFRMRGYDETLEHDVYWLSITIDTDGSDYPGPGPLTGIVVSEVTRSP
jgi:hypothetical protein